MKTTIVVLCLSLCACAAQKPLTYGQRGPQLQADVYHPTQDPLFKNDSTFEE